ncbi:dethiobiotin synthase [Kitasatospora sp. NPDC059571]|uniref:dethiobiotin synthase n=1 Tax=Kitasatospora sp. NPDC059571 TaxID=3346871 RepID=UPI0036A40CCC
MTVVFVTGTGTEVGKTAVTAAVAALAAGTVAVLKPGQTGVAPGEPGDAAEVLRLAARPGHPVTVRELARYPEPLAPDTAARRSGLPPVRPEDVAEEVAALAAGHELVLVEGAGGLLVRYDEQGRTFADLALATAALVPGVEVLLVASAGLGTLNTTALTAEALRARGLPLRGVVVGSWPSGADLASCCNLADLPLVADAPLLGALPANATGEGGEPFRALAHAALSPELGGGWDPEAFTRAHAVPVPGTP